MNLTDMDITGLLDWAQSKGRNPPWRATRDLFKLAVAEILLQKTKADDVAGVWTDLVGIFPTPALLAAATNEDVREIVKGLGLGSQRTARLTAMARTWVDSSINGAKLSGLGSYGNAVLRLAAGTEPDSPPVDGNVARVVTRYYGLTFQRGEPRKKAAVKIIVQRLFSLRQHPNCKLRLLYALVDLGAGVCKPSKPSCHTCPLESKCTFVNV